MAFLQICLKLRDTFVLKKKKVGSISQMLSIFNLLIDLSFKSPILAHDPFIYPDFKPKL